MSKISDGLRRQAKRLRNMKVSVYKSPNETESLADRIDAGTAELPRGADGEPINVGDVVYGEDGRAWRVRGVTIGEKSQAHPDHVIRATSDAGVWRYLKPEWLTHERPDSWGRIADELDAWCDRADAGGRACDEPRSFAVRIRRLAGGEGER